MTRPAPRAGAAMCTLSKSTAEELSAVACRRVRRLREDAARGRTAPLQTVTNAYKRLQTVAARPKPSRARRARTPPQGPAGGGARGRSAPRAPPRPGPAPARAVSSHYPRDIRAIAHAGRSTLSDQARLGIGTRCARVQTSSPCTLVSIPRPPSSAHAGSAMQPRASAPGACARLGTGRSSAGLWGVARGRDCQARVGSGCWRDGTGPPLTCFAHVSCPDHIPRYSTCPVRAA